MQEILDWQQQGDNAEFFLMFMFDDEQDLQGFRTHKKIIILSPAWNKVDLIVEGVNYYFADVIFTPNDKEKFFPASWPTVSQLFSMGKNSIFFDKKHLFRSDFCQSYRLWSPHGTLYFCERHFMDRI